MSSKKNILVVINLFSSAENFIGGQFKYLSKNGYNMHLICSPDDRLEKFAKDQCISYYPVILNRTLTPLQDIKSLFQICKYILRHHIDIVIGHQVKGRLLSTIASWLTRVPHVIIFAHGAIFETASGIKRKLLILESKLESLLADKVVCVSQYIRELRLKYDIDNPTQQIILGAGTCGGIDTKFKFNPTLINKKEVSILKSKYGIKENDFIVGFVGRLVKDKGVVELIEAFKILKSKYNDKNIKLMVVGESEKRDSLPNDVLNFLTSSKDVVFTGKIAHSKMPIQYLCMDCLILPSHREGFGFCNLEAQAMNIPVLTSNITGCRDSIVDGKSGLYIDLNPKDIAEKISILFDVNKRVSMGNSGREWVRNNFDHQSIWPHVKSMLDNL